MPSENFYPTDIKLVSFDIWRTIFGVNTTFSQKRKRLLFATLQAVDNYDYGHFSKVFDELNKKAEQRSELSGEHVSFEQRITDICTYLNLVSPTARALRQIQNELDELALNFPPPLLSLEIPQLFKSIITTGREIALISNVGLMNSTTVRKFLNFYDLQKDISYHLFSDELTYAKPNPKIFEHLLQLSSHSKNTVLHIGDNELADYQGARKAGLQAACLQLDDQTIQKFKSMLSLNE